MRDTMLILVAIADLAANWPYIRDTYTGKTKPNAASWSTWTLVNGISAVSALAAGEALNSVTLAGSYFIGSTVILSLALLKGTRRYTLFDGICQALALVGVCLWLLARNPNVAILFAVAVDMLAALPSLRHAWKYPREETWVTFFVAGILAIFILALASTLTIASLAYPLDNIVVNFGLASVIMYRRKASITTKAVKA